MSRTVQNTMNWIAPIVRYMPISDNNSEPAISNANIVQDTVLAPPFCWDWNRAVKTFSTVQGQQDYPVVVSDFGFVEKATLTDTNAKVKEITVRTSLSLDSTQGRPDFVSSQSDDGAGNITFRFLKVPDAVYTATITYQKKAALLTAPSDQWVIPDKVSHIADYGFLTLALMYFDDPRLGYYNQKFMTALLSANRGLSEMERNIFIGNWLALTRQQVGDEMKTQQGVTAHGV